ncbi:MAG: tetratricopeptide repeat protein [Flammeovirgaceae bacterium]
MDWLDQAISCLEQAHFAQALVSINQHLTKNPTDRDAQLLSALIHESLENYDTVFEILNQLQPTESDEAEYQGVYYTILGETCHYRGLFEDAISAYNQLIELFPEEASGYMLKGDAFKEMGKHQDAKRVYLKASRLADDPEEAFYNLALIYRAELKLEKAQKYCKKALSLLPDDEDYLQLHADIQGALKLKTQV